MSKRPKIIVVSSCTGQKRYQVANQLSKKDFEDRSLLQFRSRELSEHSCAAEDMYTGQQHLRLMKGVKMLRNFGVDVDLHIVSAGYGLISGSKKIVPYECTFDTMKATELDEWSDTLNIPTDFRSVLKGHSLGIVLLGKKYLRSVQIQDNENFPLPLIFFCSDAKEIKGSNGVIFPAGVREAKDYHCGLVGLKGELFRILAERISALPDLVEKLAKNPKSVVAVLDSERQSLAGKQMAAKKARKRPAKGSVPSGRSTSDVCPLELRLGAPSEYPIQRHTIGVFTPRKSARMRYFIPDWDDLVDPRYDFQNDFHFSERYGLKHDSYEDDFYAHELYRSFNYDGILLSKVMIDKSKKKTARIEGLGVHKYLRCPRNFPIMGDCGAFGYVKDPEPPYSTEEILQYYQRLDFDYGVSIDHLIFPSVCQKTTYFEERNDGNFQVISKDRYEQLTDDPACRVVSTKPASGDLFDKRRAIYSKTEFDPRAVKRRWDITVRNGEDFIRQHKKGGYKFTPIGACQGWNVESYREMFEAYQKCGYDYIALGGLVRSPTSLILEILEAIDKIRQPKTKIHLFGIARLDAVEDFLRLGVASVDSASHLRRAWLGAGSNYWSTADKPYAAIRVPPVRGHNVRTRAMEGAGKGTMADFKRLEQAALRALRDYDKGKVPLETALRKVVTYDHLVGEDRAGLEEMYRRLLEDKPWEKCRCAICKKHGIEVLIFRRNNRNRRRGFHNTYVFFEEFKCLTS